MTEGERLVIILQELSKRIDRLNDSASYLRDMADSIRQEVRANDDRITKIIDQLNMIEDAIVNDERNSND